MQSGEPPSEDLLRLAFSRWERDLAELGGHDDLLQLDEKSPTLLDLGLAHPSGLAAFLAGRLTRLSTLFREPASLDAARTRARRLSVATHRLVADYDLPGCHLATGVVTWDYPPRMTKVVAPVLLRPIELIPRGTGEEIDFDLAPTGSIRINPALARLVAEAGVELGDLGIGAASGQDHGLASRQILDTFRGVVSDLPLRLHDRQLVGTFVDIGPSLVDELRAGRSAIAGHRTVRALLRRPSELRQRPTRPAAQVTRTAAAEAEPQPTAPPQEKTGGLKWGISDQPVETPAPPRAAPQERVGPRPRPGIRGSLLDPAQQQALAAILEGDDVRVAAPAGTGTTELAAAVVEAVAAQGNTVLVTAPLRDELDALRARLATSPTARGRSVEEARAAHRELHTPDPRWGLSRMQVLDRLVELGAAPDPSASRLSVETLTELTHSREEAVDLLVRGARAQVFTDVAVDSPWAGASLPDADAARTAHDLVKALIGHTLPTARRELTAAAQATGLPPGRSVRDWQAQVSLMGGVRRTLDLFTEQVYSRVDRTLVAATGSGAERAEHGVSLSLLERRRLRKEAAGLVRPGLVAADLHTGLDRALTEATTWRELGGTDPSVPPNLAAAEAALAELDTGLQALSIVLASTTPGGELHGASLEALTARLTALAGAGTDLADLPEREDVAARLAGMGLAPIVEELRRAGTVPGGAEIPFDAENPDAGTPDESAAPDAEKVAAALEVAWLQGVLGQMGEPGYPVTLDPVDPLPRVPVDVDRALTAVTSMAQAQHLDPTARFDTVLLLDAHRIGLAEAVLALSRGRQTVLIGDPSGIDPAGLDLVHDADGTGRASVFSATRDRVDTVALDRVHRQPEALARLTASLTAPQSPPPAWAVPSADGGELTLMHVPGGTVPVHEDGDVVAAMEVERIVSLVAEHSRSHPDESLAVLTVSRGEAAAVSDGLRHVLRRSPDLAAWLSEGTDAPFVVTDLRHADEAVRDHVLLGLGFARTPHGRVVHQFGALDSPGGAGLLAIGAGRARRRLTVVSCLWPEELDAERLTTDGGRRLGSLLVQAGRDVPRARPVDEGLTSDDLATAEPGPPRAQAPQDPVLDLLVQALTAAGAQVSVGEDPAASPDVVLRPDGRAPVAVLWDGWADPALAVRSELDAALTRFGWQVARVHAEDVATAPEAVAAALLDRWGA